MVRLGGLVCSLCVVLSEKGGNSGYLRPNLSFPRRIVFSATLLPEAVSCGVRGAKHSTVQHDAAERPTAVNTPRAGRRRARQARAEAGQVRWLTNAPQG